MLTIYKILAAGVLFGLAVADMRGYSPFRQEGATAKNITSSNNSSSGRGTSYSGGSIGRHK